MNEMIDRIPPEDYARHRDMEHSFWPFPYKSAYANVDDPRSAKALSRGVGGACVGVARNIRQLFYVRTTGCVCIPFIGRVG